MKIPKAKKETKAQEKKRKFLIKQMLKDGYKILRSYGLTKSK